ncbi:MAG: efflux RND transporter permease subunit [Gemmatimonadetes bacterium]|nr:efflux RND transporter permease subunit [Gemmatimonadota bacterium]MYC73696.1 efflux RND transporter permease subunit [Gemmatimonadota bacterium]MYI63666.1 efflux RND transporter permease subunit [Gemmatimonadota bacterium]
MNLTQIALENNRVTIVVLLVVALLGLAGYQTMPRDSMPPYTIRVASVVTSFPGAGPERVEALITSKIEEVAQELPELKTVASESRTGLSVVSVELEQEVLPDELQAVWNRLRRKIDTIRSDLPEGIRGPEVKDDGIGVVYGIVIGLTGDGFTFAELETYAKDLRDDLIKLPDAAEVKISGIQEERIYLQFNDARLAELGLSAQKIKNSIASTNIVFSGGEVSLEDERLVLEPTGSYADLDDLGRTLIAVGKDGSVYLGDVTRIVRDYETPQQRLVKINGQPGLSLSVALSEGANIIKLGEEIDQLVALHQARLPLGITLNRVASQDFEVEKSVANFTNNLLQSVAIVLLSMLLFLGLRTGLVVATLIPMTIIATLFIMGVLDIGLNQVSLAALIMALGMLVDNAIVVSEAIVVKMEKGTDAKEAAIESARELAVPLLVSSLTTSAAFLSFFLAASIMGEMMGPLFSVISIALLSSWLLSLTMVTLLAVFFIRVKHQASQSEKSTFIDRLNSQYKELLLKALARPYSFMGIIAGLFVLSLFGFGFLPFIFFPDSERNLLTVNLNLPLGTKIETTTARVERLESYIADSLLVSENRQRGVTDWATFVSEGPPSYDQGYQSGEANSGYAHMLLNTSSGDDNQWVIDRLDAFCFRSFPDAEIRVSRLAGGGGGSDVAVRITGPDPNELFGLAERIKQKLNEISTAQNIGDDWGPKIKKVVVDIDPSKTRNASLTNQDIALSLQTALTGFNTGAFREGDQSLPIVLRNESSQNVDVRQLESINIYAQGSGKNVPLGQVAQIVPQWQLAKIKRRDLYRTLTVTCDAKSGFTAQDITDEFIPWLEEDSKSWKPGYRYELGGESEQSSEAMSAVVAKLPLSGFIILALLIVQFNSFRKTFIVLSTIPLGLIGVIAGLLVFRSFFGFFAFLGLISLAGIVINNAIVLIDRIQIELNQSGRASIEAIVAAAQQRFRPILLTTCTTTLGLIPLYLGGGLMWEPMAVAIMVGLLFATVITLLFVPVLYKILFAVKN